MNLKRTLRLLKSTIFNVPYRSYKNFGHKRQPEAPFTVMWHGFLTFTFIGMGINWKRISTFIFGSEPDSDAALPLE